MNPGLTCRFNHLLRIGLAETGDVLGNAAAEQLDVLGQVAEMGPELVAIPLVDIGTVQSYGAGQCRPYPHQHPGQRRLAGARSAQHAQYLAGVEAETDLVQGRQPLARRRGTDLLEAHPPLGRRQCHAVLHCRMFAKQAVQALVGQPG